MDIQVSKDRPIGGNLGEEVFRIKKKMLSNILTLIIMVAIIVGGSYFLSSGGAIALMGIRLPSFVSWGILALAAVGFATMFYRAFFVATEVVFYRYGIMAGKKIFYYADISDVGFDMEKSDESFLLITGSDLYYQHPTSNFKKSEREFVGQLSEFLKSRYAP